MDNNGMNYGYDNNNYNGMNNVNNYNSTNNYGVQKTNALAIVGLILSFVPILSVIGWILCIIALIQIRKTGEKGKVLAIIGLAWGVIVIFVITAIVLFFKTVVWPNVKDGITNMAVCSVGPDNTLNDESSSIVCGSVVDGKFTCEFTSTSGETKTISCDMYDFDSNYDENYDYEDNYDNDYNDEWSR